MDLDITQDNPLPDEPDLLNTPADPAISIAPLFIIAVLLLCITALVTNTLNRQTDFQEQRDLFLKKSIEGVSREISLQITDMRRSVKLLGQRESETLDYLAVNGDDQFTYEDLVNRARAVFPQSRSITVANGDGETLIEDFGQEPVGESCKADIRFFAENHKQPGIYIHPSISGHHIDIMVPLDPGAQKPAVFFISFKPDSIIELLSNSQLYNYRLLVLSQKKPGQIELTAESTREDMPKAEQTLSTEQLRQLSHRQSVPGTFWDLAYQTDPRAYQQNVSTMWRETGIEIFMLLLMGLLTMIYIIRSDNRMLTQHARLTHQAEELDTARQYAESASRSKSSFLASMSHELRTPLNAILGYNELLQDEVRESGHDHYLHDLERINISSRHLLTLISDVLDLSKIEAGKISIVLQEFHLPSLIEEIAQSMRSLVKKNNNRFNVECDAGIDGVHMDRLRVRQVLINILGNAARFTENGEISLRVTRQQDIGQDHIVITIDDTGAGIAEDEQDGLFDEFTQAGSQDDQQGGSGLGLAISRKLCESMGGSITVTSTLDKGTCFTVSIPAAPDDLEIDVTPEVDVA